MSDKATGIVPRHEVVVESAAKFVNWIRERGGVAVWKSINLSNLGVGWGTPAQDKDGKPTKKPNWQADSVPSRIVTKLEEVEVLVPKEVQRFQSQ